MTGKPYGLLCPISKACEILQPRWTIQIMTELWSGSTRFNDIRRGVGRISSSLLSKRLKEMEQFGLIRRIEDRATGSVEYVRTEKGIELEEALNALAVWGLRNIDAEMALFDTEISTMMWQMRRWIVADALPRRRTVIRFHFTEQDIDYDTYWIVSEPGAELELCTSDPGFDVDLFFETTAVALGGALTGRTSFPREMEKSSIFLSGNARLIKTIDRWLPGSGYTAAAGEGIARLS